METTESFKIDIIKIDDTEKKIPKLKNKFEDSFYDSTEIKKLSVKIDLKEDADKSQQKGRPIQIHLQDQVADESKQLLENGCSERATEITEDAL